MPVDDSLKVIVRLQAGPGQEDEVRTVLYGLLGPTRRESGCVRAEVWEDEAAPGTFTVIEAWTSGAALEEHLASTHVIGAKARLDGLLDGAISLERLRALD